MRILFLLFFIGFIHSQDFVAYSNSVRIGDTKFQIDFKLGTGEIKNTNSIVCVGANDLEFRSVPLWFENRSYAKFYLDNLFIFLKTNDIRKFKID